MKTIVLLSFCALVMAAPTIDKTLPALEMTHTIDEQGQYILKYVTHDGTIVIESGKFVPTKDGKGKVLVYEGSFTYRGDDGKMYITKYTADSEKGFVPEGDHLPVAPEVPKVPEVPAVPIVPELSKVDAPEPPKIDVIAESVKADVTVSESVAALSVV